MLTVILKKSTSKHFKYRKKMFIFFKDFNIGTTIFFLNKCLAGNISPYKNKSSKLINCILLKLMKIQKQ